MQINLTQISLTRVFKRFLFLNPSLTRILLATLVPQTPTRLTNRDGSHHNYDLYKLTLEEVKPHALKKKIPHTKGNMHEAADLNQLIGKY